MQSAPPPDEPGPGSSGAAPASPPAPPPPRPGSGSLHDLRRSRHERILGGVAAGIARNYGWDPTLVRLAFIIAALFGIGIPVYVVAWIVIPPEPDDGVAPPRREAGPIIGLILLGIGVLWIGTWLAPSGEAASVIWPLALIAGGIAVLYIRAGSPDDTEVPADPVAAGADTAPASVATTTPGAPATPAAPAEPVSAWAPAARWPSAPPPRASARPRPPRRPRPRPYLAPLTLSVVAIFAGVVALLAALDAVDVDIEVVGAIALGLLGAGLVVSAWYGRARGVIPFAVLLTLMLTVVAVVDTPLEGGIGERNPHPTTLADLEDEYRLAIGTMTVDLRDVPFERGTTEVDASVAIGELDVRVPADVRVEVHAEAGVGSVVLFGNDNDYDGTSVEVDEILPGPSSRVLRLDLRAGVGEVEVSRAEGGTR